MAYQRYQGYQYETSPRKLEPEYEIRKNPYQKKKVSTRTNKKQNNQKQVNKQLKAKVKVAMYLAIAFAILFAISYRNSLITESFNKKEELKSNLAAIEKENEQIKINIEKSLNLNNVEQSAKEMLGMQKLSNNQKVYINLPKQDYIESGIQEIVIEENISIWDKIVNFVTSIIN